MSQLFRELSRWTMSPPIPVGRRASSRLGGSERLANSRVVIEAVCPSRHKRLDDLQSSRHRGEEARLPPALGPAPARAPVSLRDQARW